MSAHRPRPGPAALSLRRRPCRAAGMPCGLRGGAARQVPLAVRYGRRVLYFVWISFERPFSPRGPRRSPAWRSPEGARRPLLFPGRRGPGRAGRPSRRHLPCGAAGFRRCLRHSVVYFSRGLRPSGGAHLEGWGPWLLAGAGDVGVEREMEAGGGVEG